MGLPGPSAETLATFAFASALIELTPGPNMAYLAVVASAEGRRRGLAAVAGVALGLAVVGLAAALGLAALISASPVAYQLLRWAGIGYMLWLAWDGWRESGDGVAALRPLSTARTYFQRGLITNLLNPKAAVFYISVLPPFVDPSGPVGPQTLLLSAIYVVIATAIHAGIVLAAGSARAWLADPRRARIARRVLSLALAAVAVWFAWRT